MDDLSINEKCLETVRVKLEDIQATQMKLVEKVISTHIDAYQLSCRDFDMIMNRIHNLVCQCDHEVLNAIRYMDEYHITDENEIPVHNH